VAVNEAEVESLNASKENDAIQAKKWSVMAADMIETLINDARIAKHTDIRVAKRRETKNVLVEHDMAAAGLTQSDTAGQPAQLTDVQGLIKSKFTIQNNVHKGKQRTISGGSLAAYAYSGYYWGGGGGSGSIQTEEVESVSREFTVNCSFSLYDKAGDALFQYNQKVQKFDSDKPGAVFGSSKTEANLSPVDLLVGELVEQGTREFVSMFVPTEMVFKYEIESSSNDNSADGVRKMRARFYKEAIPLFQLALAKDSRDDKSMFCLGICYEVTGQYNEAISLYRQAASTKGVDEITAAKYMAAADRLDRHKGRIVRPNN